MNETKYLNACLDQSMSELTENILPFWMEHGLDREHGGVYTCLDRDGRLMDTTKSVWFQGRFGFIAAFAYNQIELDGENETYEAFLIACDNASQYGNNPYIAPDASTRAGRLD